MGFEDQDHMYQCEVCFEYERERQRQAAEIERLRAENETLRQAAREIWARQMTCDDVYEYDLKRWPWLAAGGKDE